MADRRVYGPVTRVRDTLIALLAILLLSPLLAVVTVSTLVLLGRPLLYRDERAGRDGRPFLVLKFRTMRALRPGETIPASDADRLGRVGRFLRSTSIDELPALLNVISGDMALVGPRPLPLRYVPLYSPEQRRRLEVRPGITGWAQVNGRNSLSWDERFALDVWYVDNRSTRLDVRILIKSITTVLGREGISHADHATMPPFEGPAADQPDSDRFRS